MANTEGMPDEFVESLATAGSVVSSFSSAPGREEQRLRARQRQIRLQGRMELPMSGSPAAKIIRRSPNNHAKSRMNEPVLRDEDSPSSSSEVALAANALPLVGDIIEHNQSHNQHRSSKKTSKVSRFSSRNRQLHASTNATDNSSNLFQRKHVTGFPSVHDVPLGTFVKRKKKTSQKIISPTTTMATKQTNINLNINSTIGSTNSHNLMKEASQNESQAMLAALSLEEIKDQQQEIEQALSPDMIAFLKRRRKQKPLVTNGQQTVPNTTSTTDNDNEAAAINESLTASIADKSTNKNKMINHNRIGDEEVDRKEKERMAKLVASIRTHEDLDATYRMEMKGDVFDIDFEKNSDSKNNGNRNKEEFSVACDLLRSSSPRQTLWAARTVSLKLEGLMSTVKQQPQSKAREENITQLSIESESSMVTTDELPSVLSVSLRCLLDKPLNSSCNYLLHTYALQSLYYLTIIYAHPDHDVIYGNSTSRAYSGISIFQEDFMDDAVPSPSLDTAYPPMSVRPLAVDENTGQNNITSATTNQVAAYMTSSSTSSALTDGEDFKKDPMWTLLSKMKIIPRLAFLLEHQQHMAGIPTKAFIAICGIISMVGQRSPGAASAIVQHKTLTSLLLKRMLERIQQGRSENEIEIKNSGDGIIFSTIRLLCILSRQSRVVAKVLPLEDILPPLLATGLASSYQQFRVQQHALFLWRTMLRYGLGLEALASMLTISARHLALPYSNKFSLSSDFLSSFTLVLECVKVVQGKNRDILSTSTITTEAGLEETLINQVSKTVVETAMKMMTSTLPTIFPKTLTPPSDRLNLNCANTDNSLTQRYRWDASRLLYLSVWFQLFDPAINTRINESIEDYISFDHQATLLLTLQAWAEPSSDIDKAWKSVPKWCDSSLDLKESSLDDGTIIKTEASACAFINAYFSITLVLLRSKALNRHIEDIKRSFHRKIVEMIIMGLKLASETLAAESASNTYSEKSLSSLSSARVRWINQSQFAVAKLCFHSISMGLIKTSSEISLVRGLAFSLLGRLQKGNESIAAVLFSSDILFQTSGNPVQNEYATLNPSSLPSPICSMFLGEICGSEYTRKQLDHSFKLQHGFGITSAGFGPFQLDSLLSSAETSAAKDNPGEESFPLGSLWLWQCLSGSIRVRDDIVASGTNEAADVIAAVLELILDLDETEEKVDSVGYAGQLPIGSKLYYLMNVCLHHEQVLRDDRILNSGEILLDRYLQNFGYNDNDSDIVDFCQECLDHSGHSSKNGLKNDDEDDNTLDAADKKLLDDFSNAITIDLKDSRISSEQIRAMVAFLEDLTSAYRDYGAQYDFFTKCIRVFLLPMFPSLIRCRGLRELEKMLHLLTVSNESEDDVEIMTKLVSKSLIGGLPEVDDSIRDDTDVLNAVAKAIGDSSPRPLDGYMRHYCIGMLVRNFAISLSTEQGVELSKKRLERLNAKAVQEVCKATELFLQSREGTKSALVKAIICSSSCDYTDDYDGIDEEQYVVQYLDSCIARNSSCRNAV